MKIHSVKLENFMLFDKLNTEFSPNVNLIFGENSSGKTALIKLLYSCAKRIPEILEKKTEGEDFDYMARSEGFLDWPYKNIVYIHSELQDVFCPDRLDHLVNICSEGPARITVNFENDVDFQFEIMRQTEIFHLPYLSLLPFLFSLLHLLIIHLMKSHINYI